MSEVNDLLNTECHKCVEGHYVETSQFDDYDGLLHCDKCNHEVKRHPETRNEE